MGVNQYDVFCGVVVNGVRLGQPHCRTVEDCVKQILEEYKRELERLREPPPPPPPDPAEELLKGVSRAKRLRRGLGEEVGNFKGEAGGNS